MNKTYIGIDNGVTGAVGVITPTDGAALYRTPVKKEQSYTKKKQNISRIDFQVFYKLLNKYSKNAIAIVERPYANPTGFKATVSAMRALETTLIVLEMLDIPYQYIDSREWQKKFLPTGLKGTELKTASSQIGCRLFPYLKDVIEKQGDADAILIAEYARRMNL